MGDSFSKIKEERFVRKYNSDISDINSGKRNMRRFKGKSSKIANEETLKKKRNITVILKL